MEALPLTIEVEMPTIPQHLIEQVTTMTERETESTWIREMIRMQEAMTTTIHLAAAVPTSQERVEITTTVT
jgi:hypothetical protein